jgi:threonine aldolase
MIRTIDLRSDTVTRPTDAMRAAMAAALVGDDQYGEDPTTNQLQARVAELLGKEAALWVPTGTMANQIALRVLTRPGDEVIASRESHAAWHETGGAAANAGVQVHEIGARGVFNTEQMLAAIKPRSFPIFPNTTLVEIENTHNRAGGVVVPQAEIIRICAAARERGLATFLDGARLWNASIATGLPPAELVRPFDLAAVAFSKGLGAPGGSLLAGTKALIHSASRHRLRLGGAMRQNGIFAAAALQASTITWRAWPRIMPMHARLPNGSHPVHRSNWTWRPCRRTSSCFTCLRICRWTRRPWPREHESKACC